MDTDHCTDGSTDDRTGAPLDDRAVSSTLSYVLAIGVTTILITGLVVGLGGFLTDERERATRNELEALGARMADDVAAADRLAVRSGSATVEVNPPEEVIGTQYGVELGNGDDCETAGVETCLVLTAPERGVRVTQPLANRSTVSLAGTGEDLRITAVDPTATTGDGGDLPPLSVPPTVGVGDPEGGGVGGAVVGNSDPLAGFVFSPGSPRVGQEVTFLNRTADLDGVIDEYEWTIELPGGGNRTVLGPTANHTFDAPGEYNVTLEVTDDDEESDQVSRTVRVSGLVYNGDAEDFDRPDLGAEEGGVRFSLYNNWTEEVEILTVGIDPVDDGGDVQRLDHDGDDDLVEIRVDSEPEDPISANDGDLEIQPSDEDGAVRFSGGVDVPEDGIIVDLERGGDASGDYPIVAAGENVTIDFTEFDGPFTDADSFKYEVAVRYQVAGSVYTTKFPIFGEIGGTSATWNNASDWDANASATNVTDPGDTVSLNAAGGLGPPTAGMEVYLPLDGTSTTTVTDASGNGNDFDVRGLAYGGFDGFRGTAYVFSPATGYFSSGHLVDDDAPSTYLPSSSVASAGDDAVTVAMWVQADSTGTNAGLFTTDGDDNGDGQDDEMGLRYDASGFDSSPTISNTLKASVATGSSESYSYEYEENTQTTEWQHVVYRWEAGEGIDLFLNQTEQSIASGADDGATPPDAGLGKVQRLAIGLSQKDGEDASWDGKIDEVRVYDDALGDLQVERFDPDNTLRAGEMVTGWKTTPTNLDLSELRLSYDAALNNGSVRVAVVADLDAGGTVVSDPVVLDGDNGVTEVEGLSGSADRFRLRIELLGPTNSTAVNSITIGD